MIVIGGSLAPTASNDGKIAIDDLVYYKRMYKAGAANYFDALGVRVDGHNNPPKDFVGSKSVTTTTYKNNSAFYFRHYEDVYAVMAENGDKDKKAMDHFCRLGFCHPESCGQRIRAGCG